MLTCEDVNDFLIDYLDGTLDENMRERFEAHIAKCEQCRRYLEQYRQTVDMVKEFDEMPEPPDELVEKTLTFLRNRVD